MSILSKRFLFLVRYNVFRYIKKLYVLLSKGHVNRCCTKLRANLWFASLTKQSFVWRQNYVLQALQSFVSFVQALQTEGVCNPKIKFWDNLRF